MTQNGSPGERSPEREELVEGIERTRQDLAETVEALAAKADVPTRVRGKATEVRERVTGTFATLTDTAREKAPQVREAIPEPARRTTEKAVRAAGERPAVLYAVAGAFTAAGLWMWRLRRRS
jgi:hypothetical protein